MGREPTIHPRRPESAAHRQGRDDRAEHSPPNPRASRRRRSPAVPSRAGRAAAPIAYLSQGHAEDAASSRCGRTQRTGRAMDADDDSPRYRGFRATQASPPDTQAWFAAKHRLSVSEISRWLPAKKGRKREILVGSATDLSIRAAIDREVSRVLGCVV
jgi:hypothetical protein